MLVTHGNLRVEGAMLPPLFFSSLYCLKVFATNFLLNGKLKRNSGEH